MATQPNQFVRRRFSDELNPKLAVKWMFIARRGRGMQAGDGERGRDRDRQGAWTNLRGKCMRRDVDIKAHLIGREPWRAALSTPRKKCS